MVQPGEDRYRNHPGTFVRSRTRGVRNLLLDALMRSCLVEVDHIRVEHALELPLMQDQQVIQAFLSDTPHKPLTDGVGLGSLIRGFEKLDATGRRHPHKRGSKLAIVISYQILGSLSIRSRFPELLRNPGIGRSSCHTNMDDLTRLQFDEEEREERSKEEVGYLQEVTGPDLSCVVARDRSPTSGHLAAVSEPASCTSEWCACRHGCPA